MCAEKMVEASAARSILRFMGDFKKLLVWRKAQALAINVHRLASRMRGPGTAILRNQMIRAAMSIPTNIVEGHGQASKRDFGRFLGYALNSGAELEQHLITGREIGAIGESDFVSTLTSLIEVRKMIYGLRASLGRNKASTESSQGISATEKTKSQVDSD